MYRSLTVLVLLVITFSGFVLALVLDHPLVAYIAILGGLLATIILSISWARPEITPEHHPRIDRFFDDERP